MLYRKVDCPHCGNEIIVNSDNETHKCQWCRRLVSVKFKKKPKGRKFNCDVEAIDFSESQKEKFYSNWKDKDTYGKQNKS